MGWYRKTFTLDKRYVGKQTYVWVNGRHVGNHPYGYTSFSYDLTTFLNPPGKSNVIAVRAKNLGKNSRWYAGSGIYRHVWLTPVNPLHTELDGNYVTTPNVSTDAAKVTVQSSLANTSTQSNVIDVRVDVVNPAGQVVASQKQSVSIAANSTVTSTQQLTLTKPALWTLESPVLHSAKVTLHCTVPLSCL